MDNGPSLFPPIEKGHFGEQEEEVGQNNEGDVLSPSQMSMVSLFTGSDSSSVCIDDEDAEYQNAMSVLRTQHTRNSHTSRAPAAATSAGMMMSDFEQYNRRVAREVVLKERITRRFKRQRQAKYNQASRYYGNYFSVGQSEGETVEKFTPSHAVDSFNGRRQNSSYNYQLNRLNEDIINQDHLAREGEISLTTFDAVPEEEDNLSFVTLDVDALESEDEDDLDSIESISTPSEKPAPRLKRRLYSRHVQLMSLGAGIGVGVLINSGQTMFVSGPLGLVLGYIIAGIMVLCAVTSFGEMVALVPSEGGIPALIARFGDRSLGLALGACYWIASSMALPSEVTAGAIMLTYYPELTYPTQSVVVWILFFLMIVLVINLTGPGSFGEVQMWLSLGSVLLMLFYMVLMFVVNSGISGYQTIGLKYWRYSQSDFEHDRVYGPLRPVYPLNVSLVGDNVTVTGIGGSLGRFIQVWAGITSAAFSYVGTEIIFVTAGEVRNPRKAVPTATKTIFFRVAIVYILTVFAASLNVYAGDTRFMAFYLSSSDIEPELPVNGTIQESDPGGCAVAHTAWSTTILGASNASPFIIALQNAGQCAFASAVNATFIVFAVTSGVAHLYAASRTLYGLAQISTWPRVRSVFGRCSYGGVPYVAVLVSFSFSFLAFLTANHKTAQVFEWLVSLTTSSGLLVWAGMCFVYIRFYKALQLRPDITPRDHDMYPYKSPFQPYTAYAGLTLNTVVAVFIGFPMFLKEQWDTQHFFAVYVSLFFCIVVYMSHKLITRSKFPPLSEVDLDTGRKEMERVGWVEDRVYTRGWRDSWWAMANRTRKLLHSAKRYARRIFKK
ncbi:SPS-sensor component Ssy1p [Trichomonascus vanleenenianus]|uniref:Ssy1p n=1 Tax=Trichomonascus vanleenenianus TaxID=2268995 RepID=UPI003ECA8D15